ncbi:hypothetical protein [Streptomyces gibsoniae]|uniref:Uncharacterized protein n=1 Tax=Streptomyces gibsoniae TaxID=3075529 RepID=A0ABU2TV21_9ACTN|nr:hypothetical protein [Streptomyces sp. DSM 41699]MDT0464756.1 hypothetical protein [Streptomyces sp. DSM 41699]
MDQGVWTIFGVVAGSGSAIAAAFITARGASRNQLHTQQRDKRREAYAAFLSAAHDLQVAVDPHAAQAFPLDHPPATEQYTPEWSRTVAAAYAKLCAADPLIRLEGPDSVGAAAQEVLNCALILTQSANTVTQPDFNGTAPGIVMRTDSSKFGAVVSEFLVVARATLNP